MPNLVRSISHTLAALLSGSTAFRSEWKRCGVVSRSSGIEGRWQGEWVSEVNGHHGGLRGVVSKSDAAHYCGIFHATYAKFLRVSYVVSLSGREQDGRVELEGEADLGRLAGGVYHYAGKATSDEFNCSYDCKYDHGSFRMNRVD